MNRLIFNLSIVISIMLLPWWVVLLCAVVSIIFINKYYELVIFGIIYDLIYGVSFTGINMYYGVIFGIILFLISTKLKQRLIKFNP